MVFEKRIIYTDEIRHELVLDDAQMNADRDAVIDDARLDCGPEECQIAGWLGRGATLTIICPSTEQPSTMAAEQREESCRARHYKALNGIDGMADLMRKEWAIEDELAQRR